MELSDVFSSATLKASDLDGRDFTLTIESVEPKQFKDGNKLVITFRGAKKALVCNKTNANRIAMAHGQTLSNWIGKQITLYPDLVEFQGDMVDAIRVRPPQRASVAGGNITTHPQRMAEQPLPQHRDDRNGRDPSDEIPF